MHTLPKTHAAAMLLAAAGAAAAERSDAQLQHLLQHDCGSCHGLHLTGGLGPALTPAALAGKPADWLAAVILNGVRGSAMPGWRGILTDAEARRLARLLEAHTHENR